MWLVAAVTGSTALESHVTQITKVNSEDELWESNGKFPPHYAYKNPQNMPPNSHIL